MSTKEHVVITYTIISTNDGYMIEYENEDNDTDYIHAPDGDNLFNTYAQACVVLANYLLKEVV
jgi:hypothetical protein